MSENNANTGIAVRNGELHRVLAAIPSIAPLISGATQMAMNASTNSTIGFGCLSIE
jgi:hypothetical protein